MIRTDAPVEPGEYPVLRDARCRDIARQAEERPPHALSRLYVPPPVVPISFASVRLTHRIDVILHPPERLLVKCRLPEGHLESEVDDPLSSRPPGEVHAIHPRLQNVGVGPGVRVRWQTEPLPRLISCNVEGATLRVAHERDAGILR